MEPKDKTEKMNLSRREVLKAIGAATAGMAAGALSPAEAAERQAPKGQQTVPAEHNVYGAPPGTGISLPPYYLPTPSVKNRNIYFPSTESLGPDEMRITFMGSQPWPPRISQAAECIMVELGNGKRFFFEFGPGCMRNIVAHQVPICEVDKRLPHPPARGSYLRTALSVELCPVRRAHQADSHYRPFGQHS